MLDQVTRETFVPLIGQMFRVYLDDVRSVEIELIAATAIGQRPTTGVTPHIPFSLLFRGPLNAPFSQRMYRVEHATLGIIDGLFLVPLGPHGNEFHYEAVFN